MKKIFLPLASIVCSLPLLTSSFLTTTFMTSVFLGSSFVSMPAHSAKKKLDRLSTDEAPERKAPCRRGAPEIEVISEEQVRRHAHNYYVTYTHGMTFEDVDRIYNLKLFATSNHVQFNPSMKNEYDIIRAGMSAGGIPASHCLAQYFCLDHGWSWEQVLEVMGGPPSMPAARDYAAMYVKKFGVPVGPSTRAQAARLHVDT